MAPRTPVLIGCLLAFCVPIICAQNRWTVARTPDGHPDLQGIWADNTITPFERPPELAGREFLTDAELAVFKERAARLFSGTGDIAPGDDLFLALLKNPAEHRRDSTGDYNQVWQDDGLVFDRRTSQIVDPSDGRLPPLTPEGEQKQASRAEWARLHPADGPEDRAPQERCLSFGTARVGALQARNNSYHQIVQTAGYVVIHSEMMHIARVVHLDGRPPAAPGMRFWSGDARGRWEGDTLVIDSTNFTDHPTFRQKRGMPVSGRNVHLIERLTPVDEDTLRYQATVDDPTTWTKPWTAVTTWKRSTKRIFEYACHEANYALEGILKGARAAEKASSERPK